MAATERTGGRGAHVLALLSLAVAGVVALTAPPAAAENRGSARLGVYQDDNNTLVISPMVAVSAQPTEGANVRASYLADMVTSSSVDLVSSATKKFAERRDDLSFSGGYTTRGFTTVGVSYDYSHERDFASHTVGAQLAREVLDRTLTLSLGWATSLNAVGRSGDPNFSADMQNHSLTVSGAQVLNKDTVLKLTYQGQRADGFQASVYRYVIVDDPLGGRLRTPEVVPDERWRHATVVALNHHLVGPIFVQGDYRFYRDTWGIDGHTVGARLAWTVSESLHLWLRQRLHFQGAASFYRARYAQPQSFMTGDKELGELTSSTTGLKLDYEWRPAAGKSWGLNSIGLVAKVDYLRFTYADFVWLDGMTAWIGELGTSVTF